MRLDDCNSSRFFIVKYKQDREGIITIMYDFNTIEKVFVAILLMILAGSMINFLLSLF
jgi:hypothetical protein